MRRRAAHLFGLSAFAFAQPLYDLLGRNPEFFAAHGTEGIELVLFALALLLVPPAVLVAVELAAGRFGPSLHIAFVGMLSTLVALQLTRGLDVAGAVALLLAAALGAGAAAAYASLPPVRTFATVLAAAPPVFLALFLLGSPAARLVREGEARAEVAAIAPATAPVVLLVLDELPLNSLLDARGRIDAVRFPHFAALARRADWFPNATTVHEGTPWAIPALLTGRVPRPRELPRFEDHRRSLFTLLGARYRIEAVEAGTSLCPASLCGSGDRLESLVEDSGVVYLHAVLPEEQARRLPAVTERWAGFLAGGGDEAARLEGFVGSLRADARPALHYGHFLLPHSPWRHLPAGERYDLRPPLLWGRDEVWTDDRALVAQSHQRHLLQTAYVDRLLGRLVGRLKATGLYDRALVVVVADHGISFQPGGKRRPVSAANVADIAFVPLLVKRPGQRAGRVLVRHVRTVDLLPTIADVLGVGVPWPVDGVSAYAGSAPPAEVVVGKDAGDEVTLPLDEAVRRRQAALTRQVALFGSGTPASALYGVGARRELLGRAAPPGPAVELDFVQRPGGGLVAVGGRAGRADAVGVVAGGRIVAVAPVFGGKFWALAPAGQAAVRVVAIGP